MRTYWSSRMSIPTQWWLALKFSFLPYEFVVSIQYNKIIDVCWRNKVLFSSCSRIYTPSTKKDNIRATNVGSMTISWKRRTSWDSHSSPFVFLCIQNPYIVQIARLKLSALSETSLFLRILIKIKPTLNNHICSYLNSCMSMSRRR